MERFDRPAYSREIRIPLRSDARGELARIGIRLDIASGERRFYCVALQMRDEVDASKMRDIVRYDEWHGIFHRHAPGLPKPGEATLVDVPRGMDATKVAINDIVENAEAYMAIAKLTGYEAPEDHE